MKRGVTLLTTWLLIQPFPFIGWHLNYLHSYEESKLPATVSYETGQVRITKANQKKIHQANSNPDKISIASLEGLLAKLEEAPKPSDGNATTTLLGLRMKHMAGTILFA